MAAAPKELAAYRTKRKSVKREHIAIMLAADIKADEPRVFSDVFHSDQLSAIRRSETQQRLPRPLQCPIDELSVPQLPRFAFDVWRRFSKPYCHCATRCSEVI